jgi:ATP-binding cassette subfamily B protein
MKNKYKLLTKIEMLFILLVVGLVYIQVYTQLELPSYTGEIIDVGIYNQDLPYIYNHGLVMLGISIISVLASVAASFFSAQIAISVATKLRHYVFEKVTRFSLQEYNKFGASTLITRNTNDIIQIQNFVYMMLRLMVMAPLMLIGGIIKANEQSSELSFIFWYAIPILTVLIIVIAYLAVPSFKKLQAKLDAVNLVFRENLIGVRVIRAFNRKNHEKERFQKANQEHVDVAKKVNRLMAFIMPGVMLIMNFTSLSIVYFGAIKVTDGTLQVGSIFAFLQYAMQIMFSLIMVSMIFVITPRAQASYKRVKEVLNEDPVIKDKKDALTTFDVKGEITFENVTFRYPGAEYPVISNISFTAKPGQITAVIGGTGSGKSTLINMIPRFYDVSEGAILLDGIDIRDISQEKLRRYIGYIPQKPTLFSGTLKENMLVGKEDASDEEIYEALEIAQAKELLTEESLDRIVSQSGTNLSGGQKQRLSIARAILRKPKIYIFDDSFSALDFNTDYQLRKALTPHIKDATVFIVAQRVSTIQNADQIIVLDQGKICGVGTHRELLQTCDVYREIVASQISEEEIAYE